MEDIAFGLAQTVLEKLASKAYVEIRLTKSAKDDLKTLGKTVIYLKSILDDAEKKKQQKEGLESRLMELKDLMKDAVDVLDDFECELLRRQVMKDHGTLGRKVRRFCSRYNPVMYRFIVAHRVKEIKERFDAIEIEMRRFALIESQVSSQNDQSHMRDRELSDRMKHSFVNASTVIGRDDDKAKVIDMLNRQDDCDKLKNLSLVPIVGIGGLGKTTLAQLLYNDKQVRDLFDLKMWVCVSMNFDISHLLREILKSAGVQDIDKLSLDQLQISIRENLGGRKFLLVLDDVWNEDPLKWRELRQLLTGGAEGSKVIVTTRTKKVSSAMTNTPPHELKGLSEDDSLSLFFRYSLEDEKPVGKHIPFEDIGKEIVNKCDGHPLALMTLGSLLWKESEDKWIHVRDCKIWEMEENNSKILSALRMSYDALSSITKQCFAYCSIFQQDSSMKSFDLKMIWMALGIFPQSPNEHLELEDVGDVQFKDLCDKSFFQINNEDNMDDDYSTMYCLIYSCSMHDLFHDLACSISKFDCSVTESGNEIISESSLRYLRIIYNNDSPTIAQNLEKLWSIHINRTASEKDISESFVSMCIEQSRHLRVFDLGEFSFEVLPSSIGNLRHLRYLNLSGNKKIKRLPNTICNLQSLQTLLLQNCEDLEGLPKDIIKLVSLRTLWLTTKQAHFSEKGIGCLKSLRMLFLSNCDNLKSLPHDMRSCTTLRQLWIVDCDELELASSDNVLVTLSLQVLVMRGLSRTTGFPEWLKGASSTLKKLIVRNCNNIVVLPEWLQDFMSLETLVISGCENIMTLPDMVNSLELASKHGKFIQLRLKKFIIKGLPKTTALPLWLRGASKTLQVLNINYCNIFVLPEWLQDFTSLKTLVVKGCQNILTLPDGVYCLASLAHFEISNCQKIDLASKHGDFIQLRLKTFIINNLPQRTTLPNWLRGASQTLQVLKIDNCNIVALPDWLACCVSLRELMIYNMYTLSPLPGVIQCIASLTYLNIGYYIINTEHRNESYQQGPGLSLKNFTIHHTKRMKYLPNWIQQASHTLEYIYISDCPDLIALPEWLPCATSLQKLLIYDCPKLSGLPEGMSRLTSLKHLEIKSCSSSFQERYHPETGADWGSIAYIPHVDICYPYDPEERYRLGSYVESMSSSSSELLEPNLQADEICVAKFSWNTQALEVPIANHEYENQKIAQIDV